MDTDMQRSFTIEILDDPIFRKQPLPARHLYLVLYMHRKNHFTGLFQITMEHLALDMGVSVPEIASCLAELERNRFIQIDRTMELIWVPEMRRIISKLTDKQLSGVKSYLFGLRSCNLVRAVCQSFGLVHPDSAFNPPIPIGALENTPQESPKGVLSNTTSKTTTKTDPNTGTEALGTTPARVAQGVPFQPLPFWLALMDRAGEQLRLTNESTDTDAKIPYPDFANFTHAASELARRIPPVGLDAYERVGDWIAAGGLEWHAQHNTPPWKRVCARLEDCVSQAQEWDRAGRPPIRNGRKETPPPAAPAPVTPTGEDRSLAEVRALRDRALAETDNTAEAAALFGALGGEEEPA